MLLTINLTLGTLRGYIFLVQGIRKTKTFLRLPLAKYIVNCTHNDVISSTNWWIGYQQRKMSLIKITDKQDSIVNSGTLSTRYLMHLSIF